MSRLLLVVCVSLLVLPAAAKVRYAVLPLQPHVEARPANAEWIEGKLLRELRAARVELVTGKAVVEALRSVGAKDTLSCDTACMVAVGKRLGVDFVVAPTLSLQKKVQSQGVVWLWKNRQVNVQKGVAWGEFQRMCMCPESFWDGIAKKQVELMTAYDPARELRLPAGAPTAMVTMGPRNEPGMVFVPAGPFIMGADLGEGDESPRHLVEVSAFFIDTYEVTNTQYERCVKAGRCAPARYRHDKTLNGPNHPVVAMGWDDGVAYCRFAGKRLPTEAEWEKAARGTDERLFPWGNDWDPTIVNQHDDADGFATTAPVGSYKKNVSPYGAYDMAGNAWEWTHDFHGFTYYRHSPPKDPQGPGGGVKHTMRGGSWMYDVPFFVTTHNRSPGRPWIRKKYVGFRCAKSL